MIGREDLYKGQHYTVVDQFTRPRKDGSVAVILIWRSHCADCGAAFTMTSPAASDRFSPTRRCQRHAAKGKRVRSVAK